MLNRRWVLENRPGAQLDGGNLASVEAPIERPIDDELLIRNINLSLDLSDRLWMRDCTQYRPPLGIGEICAAARWAW